MKLRFGERSRAWVLAAALALLGACDDNASRTQAPAPVPFEAVGEAGAYAGLSGDALVALRLAHLKGYVLAAEAIADNGDVQQAAALIDEGILSVYRPAADEFGALDIVPVRAAADAVDASYGEFTETLAAAKAAFETAASGLSANRADTALHMTQIATGLYEGVVEDEFVDPLGYQASYGAALAVEDTLEQGGAQLAAMDPRAYEQALLEAMAFAALWPSPEAPRTPSPYSAVLEQAERVGLALSPLRR